MKYLRRFVWYLASRLLLICVVLGLMIVTFYYAMNMANIQVVLKDGMAYRAQVVMMDADPSELTKYFMPSFLEQDQVLLAVQQGNSPYKDYNVRGIDHRLEMEWMWCWPWEDTARADITERIPRIDGRRRRAGGGGRLRGALSPGMAVRQVSRRAGQGERPMAHTKPYGRAEVSSKII